MKVGFLAILLTGVLQPLPLGYQNDSPPPKEIAGARAVMIQNTTGGIERITTIPRSSLFSSFSESNSTTCTFTATFDKYPLSNGTSVPKGTVVTSNYIFFDMALLSFPNPHGPIVGAPSRGPLGTVTRTFGVFCDRYAPYANFKRLITVTINDSLLNPRVKLDVLRNSLQLERPVIFTNPIVHTYGGLLTRYPTWLAIEPSAWRTQLSNTLSYRGLLLELIAEPRTLEFTVTFTPNPAKPSTPYTGTIGCVPSIDPTNDGAALPAFPTLPDQTEPGPNGPCRWTPPGPGRVTITARIRYSITFWASGYTEAEPDYVWTSNPTTFTTGELNAVNTKP